MNFTSKTALFNMNQISEIEVNCKVYDIDIVGVTGNEIKVTWDETENWWLLINQTESALQLQEQDLIGLQALLSLASSLSYKSLTIEIPEEYRGSLILETTTGLIHIRDLSALNKIDIKSNAGSVDVRNLKVKGRIRISGTTGAVTLSSVLVDNDIRITTTVGDVELNSVHAKTIRADSSKRITAQDIFAESSVEMTCETGNIDCSIDDVSTNYTIYCTTNLGKCNLSEMVNKEKNKHPISRVDAQDMFVPMGGVYVAPVHVNVTPPNISTKINMGSGSKKMKMHTNTGNIDVRFNDIP